MTAAARRRRRAGPKRSKGGVVLVAMPWQVLQLPSIQLGLLQPLLEEAGIRTEVRSFKLDFMEHCRIATAERPEAERIGLADYEAVAADHYWVGLGEWIFAVPPFRDPVSDDAYLDYARGHGVSERDIEKARTMRALTPAFLEACVDDVIAAAPRVVGFTCTFSQTVPSLVLAKLLKRRDPALRIVLGGSNCDGPMGGALLRAFSWVDVVVRGEAEGIVVDLMSDLLGGAPPRPLPGLCYRDAGDIVVIDQPGGLETPLDRLPVPKYDEYFDRLAKTGFAADILSEVRVLYESARGCWWGAKSHCTFCGLNGSSMAFRSKSADRVLEELEALARRYGRLDFQAVDNIMDVHYLSDVLPRLHDRGYDLSVFYETKANLRREHVRLLRESGVDRIQPGLESLSTPILRLMRKGVTAFQNVRLLKWCAEYGLRVYWNVIYGFPGEPPDEYRRMAELVPSLEHLFPPTLGPLALDRFSPYHERPGDFGLEIVGPLPYYALIYPADRSTLDDLAYSFEYAHTDGRDPDTYVAPLREAIHGWRAAQVTGYRSLRYRRGPGSLVVQDSRPHAERANYTFGVREAAIYLACEDGATVAQVCETVRKVGMRDVSVDEVGEFLDDLWHSRLVYAEDGRYLTLALPWRLPETA